MKNWVGEFQIGDMEPFVFGSVQADMKSEAISLLCNLRATHFGDDCELIGVQQCDQCMVVVSGVKTVLKNACGALA